MSNTALKVSREYGEQMPLDWLAIADTSKEEKHTRPITDTERAIISSGVTELAIKEEDVSEEKKAQVAMYNADLKAIRADKKAALRSLRSGMAEVVEIVHTFFDYDHATVHKYDASGKRIAMRRMTPNEAQLEISQHHD